MRNLAFYQKGKLPVWAKAILYLLTFCVLAWQNRPLLKSKIAKTLEEARQIINDSDSTLFDSQLAPSEALDESSGKGSSDNRIAIYFENENQCQFQATQFPISKRALKLWSLMCANPAASKMISILFISMMPELYQVQLEADYKLASLYYRWK